jgi:spermidine/putrescine transport system permease protein
VDERLRQGISPAARDLGASEWRVLALVTIPMLAPAILAAFFLCLTLSWDEFIIAFLMTRFDVTLPVEIWSLLRSGLSPRTNAIGSLVFLVSVALVIGLELFIFGRKRR